VGMKKAPSLVLWLGSESGGPGSVGSVTPSEQELLMEQGDDHNASASRVASPTQASSPKRGSNGGGGGPTLRQKAMGAVLLTVLTSSGGILMQLSKEGGKYQYNTATVPFLAEVLKLIISCAMLYMSRWWSREKPKMTMEWRTSIKYTVPSILYLLCNNLALEALRYLKPSTYQILGNLRIVTTGLLTVLLLRRPLARIQWVALVLMTVGAATSQLGEDASTGDDHTEAAHPLWGIALTLTLCGIASTAGVYTELVMKQIDDSIHWQNAQLYAYGVAFNCLRLTLDDLFMGFNNGFWMLTLLNGYSFGTWLVVLNLAFSGLMVSFVMKYVDVIAKNFATASAMFLTPFMAYPLFGHEPTFALLLGGIIASLSLLVYYAKRDDLFNLPLPAAAVEFSTCKQSPGSPKAMFHQTLKRTTSR